MLCVITPKEHSTASVNKGMRETDKIAQVMFCSVPFLFCPKRKLCVWLALKTAAVILSAFSLVSDINDVQHELTSAQTVSSFVKILRNNWPLGRCSLTLISFHWQIPEIPATSTNKPSFSLLSGRQLNLVVPEHLRFSLYVMNHFFNQLKLAIIFEYKTCV